MRLFVALDLAQEIRERIAHFSDEMRALAPDVRWTKPESLHITLRFIGEQPESKISGIEAALSRVSAPSMRISFRDYGFFPVPRSARVFWVGVEAGPALAELAGDIEKALVTLGIEKEKHAFNPHLTLARTKGASGGPGQQKRDRPNQSFAAVQERLSEIPAPEFGTMTAREFFLYRSQLSSQGSCYTKITNFALSTDEA